MGYNASKGAVRIMTKSGAVQFAQHGSAFTPSILHPCLDAHLQGLRRSGVAREVAPRVPLKREGGWKRSLTVLFLASDEPSYVTGISSPGRRLLAV